MFVSNCLHACFYLFFHIYFYLIHLLNCIFLFTDYFLFTYLSIFCLFVVHLFIYIFLHSFCINDWLIHLFCMSCQWLCDADRTEGLIWIWECMWFMCIVRGAICMRFMYEFISDMTKVGWFHVWVHVRHQKGRSWGGGRAYIYILMYVFL